MMKTARNPIIFLIILFLTSPLFSSSQPASSTLEKRILSGSIMFPISTILESFLATAQYNDFASMLLDQIDRKNLQTNQVRAALARKWISNAINHIFHQELRSFLEIVVNACDASVTPDKAVGKFGMGFFSILKLLDLDETSGTKIELDTTYRSGKSLVRYTILFSKDWSGQIIVNFSGKQVSQKSCTGTSITITPNKNNFSASTLFSLVKHVNNLRCYPHAAIELILGFGKEFGREIINQNYVPQNGPRIEVTLEPKQLKVIDQGTGVPLQTALTQLLIPSNSSKGVVQAPLHASASLQLPAFVLQTNITKDTASHFFIAINGVIVIDKPLKNGIIDQRKKMYDIMINMPQGSQLTLARNELLIKSDGSSIEEKYLQQIITNTIQALIADTWRDSFLLQALYDGLTTWENESAARHLNGRFTTFLHQELVRFLRENKQCFATPPYMTSSFVKKLIPESKIQVIPINPDLVYHNYEPFEEFLIKEYRQSLKSTETHYQIKQKGIAGDLINGMHVIFTSDPEISTPTMLGLRTCLFVPEAFLAQSPSQTALINKLITALPMLNVQPAINTKTFSQRSTTSLNDPSWEKDRATIGIKQDTFNSWCTKDMTWVNNITRPLNTLAPTLKGYVQNCIQGFNVFHMLCHQSNKLSSQTKQMIDQLKQAHLGRCNAYYSISAADIPFEYGRSNLTLDLSNNGIFTACGASMAQLLEKLEQDAHGKKIIPQLMQFQKLDFGRKTDLFLRNKRLAARSLYVPDMCLGTPIGLLATAAQTTKTSAQVIKLLATIVEHVRSVDELAFVLLSLNTMSSYARESLFSTQGIIAMRLALKHYVQEKIEYNVLKKFYKATWDIDFTNTRSLNHVLSMQEPSCTVLQNLLKSLMGQKTNFPEVPDARPYELRTYSCTQQPILLSQLLNAHCQGNGLLDDLQHNRMQQVYDRALRMKSTKLEKITQSIEAGSEKDALEGTIVECLQNSIDATKSLFQQKPHLFHAAKPQAQAHIDIKLGWMRCTNDATSVVLTLHDFAGFTSLKELLTDFILPDLSNKSPALGLIGQMGNGSFKLYQEAEHVTLLTRSTQDPEHCYMLIIKPVRSLQTKTVQDLQLSWHNVSAHIATHAPEFFGTSITIQFQKSEHEQTHMALASTLDFLRNGVGSCNARLDAHTHFTIALNGTQLNQPDKNTLLYEHVINNKVVCRLLKNHHAAAQSYVTTAGIPFRSLNSVAQEMNLLPAHFCKELEQGYIIDLAPEFYEPVQSRTRLQMSEHNIQTLSHIFFELFFIDGLNKAISEIQNPNRRSSFLTQHFTHFFSTQSISQLKLSSGDHDAFQKTFNTWITSGKTPNELTQESFFDFYKPLSFVGNSFTSFYDLIDALSTKVSDVHTTFHKNIIESYLNQQEKELEQFIKKQKMINAPEVILSAIKNHFEHYLDSNNKKLCLQLYKTSEKAREKIFEEITIGTGYLTQKLSQDFVNHIAKNWVTRKMGESTFTIDRCLALDLLMQKDSIAALKAMIEKDELIKILHKPVTPTPQPQKNDHKIVHVPEAVCKCLNKAWTLFCQEFFKALGKPQPNISCAISALLSESVAGCYVHTDKAILINPSSINVNEQLKLFQALAAYDPATMPLTPIIESPAFKALYAPIIGKAPTLLHELEHARRAEKIDSDQNHITGCGTHTQGYDAQGNLVHFDACANSWGAYAIQQGLIENWATRLKNEFLG